MELWQVLAAILFVMGIVAYPGWNLVLRYSNDPLRQSNFSFNFPNVPLKRIEIPFKSTSSKTEFAKMFGL